MAGKKVISRNKVMGLYKRGLRDTEIAEKLNCNRLTVWSIRKELGLKTKWFVSRERIKELHEEGMTDPEIARELKCTSHTVWEIRNRELGLKADRSTWKPIDRDKLWKDYQSGASLDDLADEYGYKTIVGLKHAIGRIYLRKNKGR